MSFVFNTAKSILCAPNGVEQLGEYCNTRQFKQVLLVTDPGIVQLNLHQSIVSSLDRSNIAFHIFSDVQVDPPIHVVESAIEFARSKDIDAVIGLGGGSSLDTAKLIAALTHSEQSITDVLGIEKIHQSRLPLLQIPTTAGTGSEVTPISIVTTADDKKMGIVSTVLLPDLAILDASLTLNLPAHITAATGIDAMVHAIEAYTSAIKKNLYSDMLAKQALGLLSKNIQTAVHDGQNMTARSNMMLGATLAGQAFANAPVAAVHALAYPLGGRFHIPHGLSNSLVLPHVLRFNATSASALYGQLADIIVPDLKANESLDEDKTNGLIQYLEYLVKDLGLPSRLSEMGIEKDDLPLLAKDATLQERLLINNPRKMNETEILSIYQAAF